MFQGKLGGGDCNAHAVNPHISHPRQGGRHNFPRGEPPAYCPRLGGGEDCNAHMEIPLHLSSQKWRSQRDHTV